MDKQCENFVLFRKCLEDDEIADVDLQKGPLSNPDSITFLFGNGNAFEIVGEGIGKLKIVDLNEVD